MLAQRTIRKHSNVKIHAWVESQTRPQLSHRVIYVRSKNYRGWLCDCENFFFDKVAKNRHCRHINAMTIRYGRYGARLR